MDIRPLSETYAVSPQIAPADVAAIRRGRLHHGDLQPPRRREPGRPVAAAQLRAAVEAAGLHFVDNPFNAMTLSLDHVAAQAAAIDAAPRGRCWPIAPRATAASVVWALALAGKRPTDELVAAGAKYGYQTANFRSQIEALAKERA
jgi:uncharacterized protein (TIGR01244 family)